MVALFAHARPLPKWYVIVYQPQSGRPVQLIVISMPLFSKTNAHKTGYLLIFDNHCRTISFPSYT